MKIAELRQKNTEDLRRLLVEKRSRVNELEFLLRQKKVKNTKEKAKIRKEIARILTLLNS